MANLYNDSMVNELETYFIGRNDIINRWGNIVSSWSMLPGLVGFWPMSSVQRSTGNAYDMSGQGRTLTYNGNPTYNIYNNFVPYIDLDGVGDYLSRADETDLDVLGTETINAAAVRGLTLGGWFWIDTSPAPGVTSVCLSKIGDNGISYFILCDSTPAIYMSVSLDGGWVNYSTVGSPAISTGAWYFLVGSFDPSTTIKIRTNQTVTTNAVGIMASIFNSNGPFEIGAQNGASWILDGRASLCFLSHQVFSDALTNAMFQQSRILFGV